MAALIFNGSGDLLVQRRKGSHGAGKWSTPGGWMDKGEWPADAAVREVKEETGLDVSVVDNIGWTNDFHPEGVQDICFWLVCHRLSDLQEPKILEPDKCDGMDWVSSEWLREMLARGEVFLAFENFIRNGGYARAIRMAAGVRRRGSKP